MAITFAVKTTTWVAVTVAGWNELKEGGDGPPTDGVTVPEVAPAREKTKMVSEPWLLTRTLKSPLGLLTTSIALGSAGVAPLGMQFRRHAQAVALRAQEIDVAVGEGHHDLPARQGLRGQHLLAGEDDAGAADWVRSGRTAPGFRRPSRRSPDRCRPRRWAAGPAHCPG